MAQPSRQTSNQHLSAGQSDFAKGLSQADERGTKHPNHELELQEKESDTNDATFSTIQRPDEDSTQHSKLPLAQDPTHQSSPSDKILAKFLPQTSPPTIHSSPLAQRFSNNMPGQGFEAYAMTGSDAFGKAPSPAQSPPEIGLPRPEQQSTGFPRWSFPSPNNEQQLGSASNTPDRSAGTPGSSPTLSANMSSMTSSPGLPLLSLQGRKRARESIGTTGARGHAAKAMRATSPRDRKGASGSHPISRDSSDFGSDIPSDLIELLGGDPREDIRQMAETQRELERRRERMRLDEEFARRLQEELNAEPDFYAPPPPSQTSTGRANPNAGTYQAYIGSNGRLSRTEPMFANSQISHAGPSIDGAEDARLGPPDTSGSSYGAQSNMPPSTNNSHTERSVVDFGVNREQRHQASRSSRFSNPSDFVDLGSDSDSDNDLSVIPSHKFVPRPRQIGPTPNGPLEPPEKRQRQDLNGIPLANLTDSQPWPSTLFSPASRPPLPNNQHDPTAFYGPFPHPSSSSLEISRNSTNTYGPAAHLTTSLAPSFNLANGVSSAARTAYNVIGNRVLPWMQPSSGSWPFSGSARPGYDSTDPLTARNMFGRPGPFGDGSSSNPFSVDWRDSSFNGDRDDFYDLGVDPAKTAEELRSLMNNIRPDDDLGASDRTGSPEDMAEGCALYEHQKLGLAWMMKMEEGTNRGGILADDMGLGKTIQAIALIVSRRSDDPNLKTTLIVGPVALMKQWENEIRIKVKPDRRLSTYVYHGTKKNITWDKLKKFDIVLTTYGTLASEHARKDRIDLKKKANPNWRPTTLADQLPLLDTQCKFYRVILDEAQNIKNKNTKSALATYALQSATRFCMTGTPMMNNVGELYSLICFLRIRPYCEWEKFNRDFAKPLRSDRAGPTGDVMRRLQALLKAILLRRTKKSEIDGKPILTLPERTTIIDHTIFDDEQLAFYKALEERTRITFNKYLRAGTVGKNYANALVLLLRLRQACCHPHLIRDFGEKGHSDMTAEELETVARDMLGADTVRRIKEDGMADCPICMDVMENSTIFTPCGHSTCSECFTRIADPSTATYDSNGNAGTFKCMTCRGNVDPKKVTDWNSFQKVYMLEKPVVEGLDEANVETESESGCASEGSDSDIDSGSEDEYEDESLNDFIVNDDEVEEEDKDKDTIKRECEEGMPNSTSKTSKPEIKPKHEKGMDEFKVDRTKRSSKSKKAKGKRRVKTPKREKTLSELQKEGRRNAKARRKYLARLHQNWVTSCKIEKCLQVLEEVLSREDNEKTIIFSQFTTMLDLLEVPINQREWSYKRYDGSMSATARNDAVLEFTSHRRCRIMLVSLKAGNSGLNLTAANNVILFDPFWNPYIEEQAIDRAHRIGQRKPVQVHRLLVQNTVEDRIIELQEKKRAVIEGALDETAGQNIARLGVRELAFLFGVSGS